MLSNRLRPSSASAPDAEDIFSDSLGRLFPDDLTDHHGSPGSYIIYTSPCTGDLELHLSDYVGEGERRLFASHVWNAGLMLSDYIESNAKDLFNVKGQSVVELGAGSGLVSLVVARLGAKNVTITDYPSETLISTLRLNVEKNFSQDPQGCQITVSPHLWGQDTTSLGQFTRVVAADCLWMDHEHENLVHSMLHLLSVTEDEGEDYARAWIVAGFHTGRSIVRSFFDTAEQGGLDIESIWEKNLKTGEERDWAMARTNEGVAERKIWCVVAILRRRREFERKHQ